MGEWLERRSYRGGIFWREVVKYSRKYIYGKLDGGNGWSKPKGYTTVFIIKIMVI